MMYEILIGFSMFIMLYFICEEMVEVVFRVMWIRIIGNNNGLLVDKFVD